MPSDDDFGTTGVRERTAAEALRAAMDRRGLSYVALAEIMGTDSRSVHKALTRRPEGDPASPLRGMSEANMIRICRAMNCGLRYRPGDGWHATE